MADKRKERGTGASGHPGDHHMESFASDERPGSSRSGRGNLVSVEFDPLSQPNPLTTSATEDDGMLRPTPQSIRSGSPTPPTTPAKGSGSNAPTTPSTDQKSRKLYSQYFRQYELLIEYKNLANPGHCPPGMYVIPSSENFYNWHGVLFLHQCGPVKFGENPAVVKFILIIPPDYPERRPEVKMITHVYHPLVTPSNGHLDLRHQFSQWKPHKDHICHVLHYVKNCFSDTVLSLLQLDLCPNREAFAVYEKQPERFADYTRRWADQNTDSGDFEIPLKELPADEYQKAHKEMFKDTQTVFSPDPEQPTIMSTAKSAANKVGKFVIDMMTS